MIDDEADTRKRIRSILRRRPEGVEYAEISRRLPEEPTAALDLLILQELRTGRVWLHKGRFFSRAQYKRAVEHHD